MHEVLKLTVRSLYDIQKLRIEMGNRIAAQKREGVLSDEWEKRILGHFERLTIAENAVEADVKALLKDCDLWTGFLKGVKGVGPRMGGVLVAEIADPERFDTISKLWAYAGLHVIDGRAARRKRGEKANWNGFLKTKMLGVLAGSFLKSNSPYREFYDNYRTRIENRPCSMTPAEHNKSFGQRCSETHMGLASHSVGDAHEKTASHSGSESPVEPAGQEVHEDQPANASQIAIEPHVHSARQADCEPHVATVSHDEGESPVEPASQVSHESQKQAARHSERDTQYIAASHTSSESQEALAPPKKQKLLPNGCTAGHMHNKALRYMVKMFLADLYVAWREMRGLPVREPYAAEYLGKRHAS